jgi:hypothetical protein
MKLSNFIEGLTILRPYYNDPDGYHIGAEHDQFFAYATDKPLSDEDVDKMRELGWFQPDGEPMDSIYYPNDGWNAFT